MPLGVLGDVTQRISSANRRAGMKALWHQSDVHAETHLDETLTHSSAYKCLIHLHDEKQTGCTKILAPRFLRLASGVSMLTN